MSTSQPHIPSPREPSTEWVAQLLEVLEHIGGHLGDRDRTRFAALVTQAHESARGASDAAGLPLLIWPLLVTLLAHASNQVEEPLSLALIDATRAHATAWVNESQVQAFAQQLDEATNG